ncbi:MAG: bifunctional hydroxymethylpyrimidine kinase/phosphomethylpyrimidine kinase, partial [Hyphomicrobiales bacterium]|nr:bifunctional hydroxymethylpyrimidine kinase/phosphomethylpyrimidine kinase [Hyphomicrobiales bacterium]
GAERFSSPRIATRNTHGTGCTLSSAIAASLARGAPLVRAVAEAKDWLTGALAAADDLAVGRGHGPVHHFHALWRR